MKTVRLALILCATLCFAASCKKSPDMTLKQKTLFAEATISQIEVGHAWPVKVVADNSTFVEVEYSAYLENYLKINMEGTKLYIGFTGKVYAEMGSVFQAVVHTNQLEQLDLKDASTVSCSGCFSGQRLEVEVGDASQCRGLVFTGRECEIEMDDAALLTDFQFVGNTCKASMENASQFNGKIQATDRLEVDMSQASRFVNKSGVTDRAELKMREACLLNMAETQVRVMHVALSEGSEATVQVEALLEGSLRDASTLYYLGQPQVNIDCSEASSVVPL